MESYDGFAAWIDGKAMRWVCFRQPAKSESRGKADLLIALVADVKVVFLRVTPVPFGSPGLLCLFHSTVN